MMAESDVSGYRKALGRRLADIVSKLGSKKAAADAAGISVEQLNKWIAGSVKVPADGLYTLSHHADVDFSWVVAGSHGQKTTGVPHSSRKALEPDHLEDAIMIVEDWLDANDREMKPEKKAKVVTQLYEFIADDAAEGRNPIDVKRLHGILRLVA